MADLLAIQRHAVRARLLDERLSQLARAGRIGFHPDARGWDAAIVAAVLAMRPEDQVFPGPREHAALVARGIDLARYVAHAFGNREDGMLGHASPAHFAARDLRVAPPSGLVSNHMTHAAGFAWAAALRGTGEAVLTFFGQSASESGDFHSAVNFAGTTKAKIVFVCRTDRTQPSGPRAVESVADKAIGYGITGVTCAADPASVFAAVSEARARAEAGEGPSIVEIVREKDEDDLALLRETLVAQGAWSALADVELRRETMMEIEAAVRRAIEAGAPRSEALFDPVYDTLPAHLEAQRTELLATSSSPESAR